MNIELASIIILLLVTWLILAFIDMAVAGIAALCFKAAFRKFFLWGLLSFAIPVVFIIYGSFIGRYLYQVNEVEIPFSSLPESFDGYRIAQLSDIHSRSFKSHPKKLRKAVDMVNGTCPDLIAFTGDIISLEADELLMSAPILSGLKARDGVVAVLGNHDYGIYAKKEAGQEKAPDISREIVSREAAMGWEPLTDSYKIISRGTDTLAVIGMENAVPSKTQPRGSLRNVSRGTTENMFRIVLWHDPLRWETDVAGRNYPLTLSGHTHAAQFQLLGWCPSKYLFKQYRGLYEKDGEYLYVNAGLGETIFPARIGVRPEITLITLRKQE